MTDISPLKIQQKPNTKVQFVDIDADRAGQRIDNFLLATLKGVPKSRIYRILRKGEVRVNKSRAKPEYKLQSGDIVRIPPVHLPEEKHIPQASQNLTTLIEESILYEDKSLIILNKPSGLAVHGGSGISLGLIETMRQIRPQEKALELVHRLDRDTSGCIMIAKKRSLLRYLHEQLREGTIQKFYHALVIGQWPDQMREVNAPLKKNELSSGERIVRVDSSGKQSRTLFRVLQRYDSCSLVEAKPITGRTHQIRVHAQYGGHGLVGDNKYGDDEFNKLMKSKGVKRLFLHAAALEVQLPNERKPLFIEAPLEPSLANALARLKKQAG
jgi:23S rRNA pseudouridine955/2504/2580 synthase